MTDADKMAIEEMARVIINPPNPAYTANEALTECYLAVRTAEKLYAKGYRKQSEWISIAERLPEKSGRYLVYVSIAGMPLICGAHYDKYNGFGDDDFTHWMPLPEPPKGEKHDPA